jgi:rhodanese-related sulfurtransferase
LRLGKSDFDELLKKPLLKSISLEEAKERMNNGAVLLDVRTPAEFNFKHLLGAVNVPLCEIRELASKLAITDSYITCCQTGRRAAAAAFVLAQRGNSVVMMVSDSAHI